MIVRWLAEDRDAQAQSSLLVRFGAMSGIVALLLTLVNTGLGRLSAGAPAKDPGAAKPASAVVEPVARLPFQGRLLDAKGEPIATREVTVLFTLYDATDGNGVKWTSGSVTLTTDRGGLVSAMLGDDKNRLDPAIFQSDLYLGIRVDDPKNGVLVEQEPEMLPRFRIVPSLYSLRADEAKHALKADDTKLVNGREIFPRGGLGARIPGSLIDPAALVPPGTVQFYAGRVDEDRPVPAGWLVCDGSVLNGREEVNQALYEALGNTWGDADDDVIETVNLPDLRGVWPWDFSDGVRKASIRAGASDRGALPAIAPSPPSRGGISRIRQVASPPRSSTGQSVGHWLIKY